MATVPEDLLFSSDHEWVKVEDDAVTIGITDFAQGELGDIVYVELPEVGEAVVRGEVLGTIESVKSVSDLYSPVSGEVVEINEGLEEAPESVNDDPYAQGWLVKVRLSDTGELDALLAPSAYRESIAE